MKLEDFVIRDLVMNEDNADRDEIEDLLCDIYAVAKIKNAVNLLSSAAWHIDRSKQFTEFYIQTELKIELGKNDSFLSVVTITKKFSIVSVEEMKAALAYVQFLAPHLNGNFHILCYLKSEDKYTSNREISKKWVGTRKKAPKLSKAQIDLLMSNGDVTIPLKESK